MTWAVCPVQNGRTISHYGVLGMKWGVRKDTSSGSSNAKIAKSSAKKKEGLAQENLKVKKNLQPDSVMTKLKNTDVVTFKDGRVVSKHGGTGARAAFKTKSGYDAFTNNKINWNKTNYHPYDNLRSGGGGGGEAIAGDTYQVVIEGVDEDGNPIDGAIAFDTKAERDEYLKQLNNKSRAYNVANWSNIYSEIVANRTFMDKAKRSLDSAMKKVAPLAREAGKKVAEGAKAAAQKASELLDSGKKALADLLNIQEKPAKDETKIRNDLLTKRGKKS